MRRYRTIKDQLLNLRCKNNYFLPGSSFKLSMTALISKRKCLGQVLVWRLVTHEANCLKLLRGLAKVQHLGTFLLKKLFPFFNFCQKGTNLQKKNSTVDVRVGSKYVSDLIYKCLFPCIQHV